MRVFFGMILGAILTIGVAFFYDTWATGPNDTTATTSHRTMVNWDVVDTNWRVARERIEAAWNSLSRKVAS